MLDPRRRSTRGSVGVGRSSAWRGGGAFQDPALARLRASRSLSPGGAGGGGLDSRASLLVRSPSPVGSGLARMGSLAELELMPPALRSEQGFREPLKVQEQRAAENVIGQVSAFPLEQTLRAHHHFAKFRTTFEHPLAKRKPKGYQGKQAGEEDLCRAPAFAYRALLRPHDSAQTVVYMQYRDQRDQPVEEDQSLKKPGVGSTRRRFSGGLGGLFDGLESEEQELARSAQQGFPLHRSVKRAVHEKHSVWTALYSEASGRKGCRSTADAVSETSESESGSRKSGGGRAPRTLGERVHEYHRATAAAERNLNGMEALLEY